MLTREHAIAEYENGLAKPDRLIRNRDDRYVELASRMCDVYRRGIGKTRRALHAEVEELFRFEDNCPPRRIDAFCKLLDEKSRYEQDHKGSAAKLRQALFRAAAKYHPIVTEADSFFENRMETIRPLLEAELGLSWSVIESQMFYDLMEFHRLEAFDGYPEPMMLLSRYNVAQVQVALYDAARMVVWASNDFKSILRYAKLARLMHTIHREREGCYRFEFDGPASIYSATQRYGVAMARFLPGLLACRGWRMEAWLKPAQFYRPVLLKLDEHSGLRSPVEASEEFDSQVERSFAEKWGTELREGWRLEREAEVMHHQQRVFVPDFTFVHTSGVRVHFEVIGFWTPEYLQHKMETLRLFPDRGLLLAVAESLKQKLTNEGEQTIASDQVIWYKTALKLEPVLERLRMLARG